MLFFYIFIMHTLGVTLYLLFSAKLQVIEYSATAPKFPELTEDFGEMDDGLEWKDGYAMGWRGVLAGGQSYIPKIGLPGTHALLWD